MMDTLEKIEGLLRVWKDRADELSQEIDDGVSVDEQLNVHQNDFDRGKATGSAETLYRCIAAIKHILEQR